MTEREEAIEETETLMTGGAAAWCALLERRLVTFQHAINFEALKYAPKATQERITRAYTRLVERHRIAQAAERGER